MANDLPGIPCGGDGTLTILLRASRPRFSKEGEFSLCLEAPDALRLCTLTFSFFLPRRGPAIFVGGLQGSPAGHRGRIKAATASLARTPLKLFTGRVLLLLADVLDIHRVVAVDDSTHVYRSRRYDDYPRNVKACYADTWSAPAGGAPSGGGSSGGTNGGSGSGGGNDASNYYGAPLPAAGGSTTPLTVGCDWFKVYDNHVSSTQGNTAFPDTAGVYWVAAGPTNPTADESIQISGRFPAVRYFSFQAYDQNSQLADKLTDYLIQPDSGSSNPFTAPSVIDPAIAPGGSYSATLSFSSAPSQRAPNTMYRGTRTGLSQNPVTTALIYRTYLPGNGPGDPTGGVGLPTLVFHSASGNTPLAQSPDATDCRQIAANYLASLSKTQTVAFNAPTNPPKFQVYYGQLGGLAGQGTARNADAGFMYARTTQSNGTVVMVRGRAPTFAQQPNAPSVPDLRYWSFCENDYTTQQVLSCLADQDALVDRGGYYNLVVSTLADRPADADAAHGFNWLAWGTQSAAVLIYRNLLAAPTFSQASQNVPQGTAPQNTMNDYDPQAAYCSKAAFDAAATTGTPAQVFAACQTNGGASSGGGLGGLLGGLLNGSG